MARRFGSFFGLVGFYTTGPTLTSASPAFAGTVSASDSCHKIGEALSRRERVSHPLVDLLIEDLAGLDLADVASSALAADLKRVSESEEIPGAQEPIPQSTKAPSWAKGLLRHCGAGD